MEQIKKKLSTLKDEKEKAEERADDAEALRKEADARADAVRCIIDCLSLCVHVYCIGRESEICH